MDSNNIRRRFRASNYQPSVKVTTFMSSMPLFLNEHWSVVHFNIAQFTERTFNTLYMETVRIQVHANCRLRRVYFSDKMYNNDQLPNDYRLHKEKVVREKPKKSLLVKKEKAGKKKDWPLLHMF